jgi:uncharacterized protein (TIGR00369 family)
LVYERIRSGLAEAVPFAKFVGVDLLEVSDGFARARLIQRHDLSNHIGTLHAGALFTLAETTSGAAMTGAFVEAIDRLRPVAVKARVGYLKLAGGTVICTATTAEPPDELRRRLHDERKVVFEVLVELRNERDQLVVSMTVTWNVRLAPSAARD